MRGMTASFVALALAAVGFTGCQREHVVAEPDYNRQLTSGHALRKLDPSQWPSLSTAWGARDGYLDQALDQSISWFQKPSSQQFFPFHEVSTHEQAAGSVVAFKEFLKSSTTEQEVLGRMQQMFDCWQTVGYNDKGTVLFTGYYAPEFKASLTPDSTFRFPLYRRPTDCVTDPVTGEPKGRLQADGTVAPWPNRAEIQSSGMLRGLELVYLPSEFDVYIIQVNGSAKLTLQDGSTMYVGYAGKTDGQYVGLGQTLLDEKILTERDLNLPNVREWCDKNPDKAMEYINRNNCFVFFTKYDGSNWPAGSLGVKVTERTTLATDKKIYPRGGFLLVDTKSINFANQQVPFNRFMCDQDTGGAIVAPGRADIFMGVGASAEILAGAQYAEGTMYYFFLKPEYASQYPLPPVAKKGAPASGE